MKNYPLIIFTVLFICGIILSEFIFVDDLILLIIFLCLIIFSFLAIKFLSIDFAYLFLIPSIILLGTLVNKFQSKEINFLPEELYVYKDISVFGTINEIDLIKENQIQFYLTADSIKFKDSTFHSKIKLLGKIYDGKRKLKRVYNSIYPGNFIELKGKYRKGREQRNPGEFNYNKYLRSKDISGIISIYDSNDLKIISDEKSFFSSIIFDIRKGINNNLNKYHDNETSALLKGLLLADRSQIDYEIRTEFVNSGVIHVLAVSGLHVGYIVLIFLFITGRFNIYFRTFITIAGLLAFMFITGVPPSVFRATIMAVIILLAFLSNRTTNLFNSLAFAALIILIINPEDIYNPGFQLSFSAVASIGYFAPLFQKKLDSLNIMSKSLKYILLFMTVSLSAQIGTLPFTLIYFGKLSVVALFVNLLVIPLIGSILAIGITTLFFSLVSNFIAEVFGYTNILLTKILFWTTDYTGNLDFSFLRINSFSFYDALIFYLSLGMLFFFFKKLNSKIIRLAFILLIILNFSLYISFDNKTILRQNELNIMMIDIGQGDAILMQFPNGKTALIDAGEATPYFDNGERVVAPLLNYLGIDKVDYGFISHLDNDHFGGYISLIQNDKISKIIKPAFDSSSAKDVKFEKFLSQLNQDFDYYKKGKFDVGNVRIYNLTEYEDEFYLNQSYNNRSGVLKIVHGNNQFLFTGDIESKIENYLSYKFANFLDSDLLKVPHHGSKTGTTEKFLKLVSPNIGLISAGIGNKFNHPDEKIINRLEKYRTKIYRTDKEGAVLIRSDGEKIFKVNWK